MSAIPGPRSSKVSRRPARPLSLTASSRAVPPPPWSSVLRANSLAAVTILVWSTRLSPCATAHDRTLCRTATTSCCERTGMVSHRSTAIGILGQCVGARTSFPLVGIARRRAEQHHSLFYVERRTHPRQRQSKFDERDRYRGLDAHNDRFSIQHPRRGRDV